MNIAVNGTSGGGADIVETDLQIFAFDPGETTGWAALLVDTDASWRILAKQSGQYNDSENVQVDRCVSLINKGVQAYKMHDRELHTVIVVEDFILRQKRMDRSLLSPVRVSAKLEYINHLSWEFPFFTQPPSLAKSATKNVRLAAEGLYRKGQPHANDAMRHAFTFLRRLRQSEKLQKEVFE